MVDTKLIILISLALLDIINHHRMILFYYIRFRALSVHYVFNTLYFLPYSHRHYLLSWAVVTHPISKLFQDKTLDKIFVIKRIIYPQYNFTPKLSQLRNLFLSRQSRSPFTGYRKIRNTLIRDFTVQCS